MSPIVAIDFTASNGRINESSSLHYVDYMHMNDYQNALYKVCSIIEDYDQYKLIPIYGFGGCPNFPPPFLNTGTKVSHCFPATGDWNNTIGRGLYNTYQIYNWARMNTRFSGPTEFSPLLTIAKKSIEAEIAGLMNGKYFYKVIQILTDGSIHDMMGTSEIIIEMANTLPVSIIMVGIGNKDSFEKMRHFEFSEDIPFKNKGQVAKRNITQFVKFSDYKNDPVALSKSVLEVIPKQVESFYNMKGMAPLNVPEWDPVAYRAKAKQAEADRVGAIQVDVLVKVEVWTPQGVTTTNQATHMTVPGHMVNPGQPMTIM